MDALLIAAAVFGVCFLVDKLFAKLFRNRQQHKSGLSVRLNKRYVTIGLVIGILGLLAVFTAAAGDWLMLVGGILLMLIGIALIIWYMSFGLFYDEDSFLLTTFGRRSKTYSFGDICTQQLYNSYGNIVIELHLSDERSVQLQASMDGVYPFMEKAFCGWLKQTGREKEDCSFYDPQNSCWFPMQED